MKKLFTLCCVCACPLFVLGCSSETGEKASEAVQATEGAIESAAEDVVEEAEELTDEAKEAIE